MFRSLRALRRAVWLDVPTAYRSAWGILKLLLWGQGFKLLLNYRCGRALSKRSAPLKWIVLFLRRAQYRKWSCDISFNSSIGARLRMPHPLGIVIGAEVQIGNDVVIFQGVTIGSHGKKGAAVAYPIIGDRVTIYAGAKVIGAIRIGSDATIGANAVVLSDVEPGVKVAGVPARKIS